MHLRFLTTAALTASLCTTAAHAQSGLRSAPTTATKAAPVNPLWKDEKIKNYLPYMSWPEVAELLKKTDMVIIPVGAMEQHGLGGPIGTDYLNGTQRALLIAQRTDVLVAPILLPGQSPYHMEFPGTITLSSETIERVYFEAAQSLIKHGFRRFMFLNSHGGNEATTAFIVDRINQETEAVAVELNAAAATQSKPETKGRAITPSERFSDQHAGVQESSDSLYLTPGLYDQSIARAAKLKFPPHLQAIVPKILAGDKSAELVFMAEALKQTSTGKGTSAHDISDTGAWSELDPKTATAERGREEANRLVSNAVAFIEHWKKLRP